MRKQRNILSLFLMRESKLREQYRPLVSELNASKVMLRVLCESQGNVDHRIE